MNVISLKTVVMAAVAIAFCMLFPPTWSQAQTADTAKALQTAGKDPVKSKIRPYKEVIPATARTFRGFFLFHKVDDRYFMEIPDSLLGRDLLVVNRIVRAAAGTSPAKALFGGAFSYAGDEIGESIIRFEKFMEDKIFLNTVSFEERSSDSTVNGLFRNLKKNGHTLGLMHNFGSSSTVPVENLRDRAWVHAHGHTPSIMDYARFNYVAQPEDSIDENGLFPHIGDYDRWAIQWGYRWLPPSRKSLDKWQVHFLSNVI